MRIELLLVLLRRHAVTGYERRATPLVPDGSVALLSGDDVTIHQFQTKPLTDPVIKLLLVCLRREAVTGYESRSVVFFPKGGIALLLFKRIHCGVTVPFKVQVLMDSAGVLRKLQRATRNQQPPIAQKRVPTTKNIKYRRMHILQRLLRMATIEASRVIELLRIARFPEPCSVQIVIIAAE